MFVGVRVHKKVALAATLAGLAAVAGAQTNQGTTDATWLGGGKIFGSNIYLSWSSHDNIVGDNITAGAYGFMRWRDENTGGSFEADGMGYGTGNEFYSLCGQFKFLQNNTNFTAWDVSSGAMTNLPSYRADTLIRGASVLSFDYDGVGGTSTAFQHAFTTGNSTEEMLRGAGIQLAVWAAIYGNGGDWLASDYNGSDAVLVGGSGGLYAKDTDGNFGTIVGYARSYYNAARGASWAMGTGATTYWLDAFGSSTGNYPGQDQFTIDPNHPPQSVPEPFTMSLGIAGVAAYIRRRKLAQKAK